MLIEKVKTLKTLLYYAQTNSIFSLKYYTVIYKQKIDFRQFVFVSSLLKRSSIFYSNKLFFISYFEWQLGYIIKQIKNECTMTYYIKYIIY